MLDIPHHIDGKPTPSSSGRSLEIVEPGTAAVYGRLAAGDAADVEHAVQAARRAFPGWSATPAATRSALLLKIAGAIEDDLEAFARAESVDSGKPLSLARSVDIPRAVANLRFFATAILHTSSEAHMTDGLALNYTLRRPHGVVGLISPWNLPLYLLTWKVAPALATGNTAVAKPSELTPVTAHLFAEVCRREGLPPGVLNVVHGLGAEAGAPLVAHPLVRAVSFTGGTATGAQIHRTAAPQFKKMALEMGGKNPNVVFADADLREAIDTGVRSSFSNQGQICLCGSRIFVQRPVFDAYVSGLVERTQALRSGDPLDETTEQGALVSQAHLEKVRSYVRLAAEEGGTVECGGDTPSALPPRCREGFFLRPTVITGLSVEARTNCEEIFGPVVTVTPFDDEDEVVGMANATRYGLAASVWTSDLARAHRVASRIEAGTVWINCWMLRDLRVPFGGTKDSGLGREGGNEALRFFTEPTNVCVRLSDGAGKEDRR